MSALIFALSVLALMPAFASPWVSCSGVLRMRPAMVAKAVSTSLVEISRPHRLPSRTFSLSLMSSSMTSWRDGVLWVDN